jgi:hypothetical protein
LYGAAFWIYLQRKPHQHHSHVGRRGFDRDGEYQFLNESRRLHTHNHGDLRQWRILGATFADGECHAWLWRFCAIVNDAEFGNARPVRDCHSDGGINGRIRWDGFVYLQRITRARVSTDMLNDSRTSAGD